MMMKRDCCLDQSLQELLLQPVGFAPHVFPNLMRVVKLPSIKKLDSTLITVNIHDHVLARLSRILPAKCTAHTPVLGATASDLTVDGCGWLTQVGDERLARSGAVSAAELYSQP